MYLNKGVSFGRYLSAFSLPSYMSYMNLKLNLWRPQADERDIDDPQASLVSTSHSLTPVGTDNRSSSPLTGADRMEHLCYCNCFSTDIILSNSSAARDAKLIHSNLQTAWSQVRFGSECLCKLLSKPFQQIGDAKGNSCI